MKIKSWKVEIACWQPQIRGTPVDHYAVYQVHAAKSTTAIFRALKQWHRETGKRVGRRTDLDIKVRAA